MVLVSMEAMRAISAYEPQAGRPDREKNQFYNEKSREWDLQNPNEMV